MGVLTVRNLPDELIRALRLRAVQHGRAAETASRAAISPTIRGSSEGCATELRDFALADLTDRI